MNGDGGEGQWWWWRMN
ncbi:hypothetical protein A2U01_0099833, partial [Trifolium medium]|nr:hypothetical protein [Trifolium medium]